MRTLATTIALASLLVLAAAATAQPAPAPAQPDPAAPATDEVLLPEAKPVPPAPAPAGTDATGPAPAATATSTAEELRNVTPGFWQRAVGKNLSPFQRWKNFIWDEIDRIDRMDLYGVTAQLPKGYLKLKWDITMLKASRRYNDKRQLVPAVPPIEFTQGSEKMLSLDLGLSGQGGGHTIQMSYGILGNLDWYIEFPFQYMDIQLNPKFNDIDDQGNKLSPMVAGLLGIPDRKNFDPNVALCGLLTKLGRPVPGTRFKGKWALGDINTGFSWNWFRNSRISAALTPRVFFPTGRIADAENSLLYGTGPRLDVGLGGWAVGFTQGYDVRIFKHSFWIDIIASTEFTTSYGFEQKRKYPTNFTKPDEALARMDPVAFPDLTTLSGGRFSYTPGWGLNWTAQLQFQVALLGLGVGYGIMHSQEPEIDGDRNFISMVKGLQLLGQQTTQAVQLSAALTLLPLYIPAQVGFQWRKVVDGYNAIVFDDYYQITINTFLPLFPGKAEPFPSQAFPEWQAREAAFQAEQAAARKK
ncbi:MAG: hypothetical protein FJ087_02355 [Deltaproteobacteria bacterium]|nr:hypothetical protein [Deltaproteobacteria bacterium]